MDSLDKHLEYDATTALSSQTARASASLLKQGDLEGALMGGVFTVGLEVLSSARMPLYQLPTEMREAYERAVAMGTSRKQAVEEAAGYAAFVVAVKAAGIGLKTIGQIADAYERAQRIGADTLFYLEDKVSTLFK